MMREYTVIVGKRGDIEMNAGIDVKAKNLEEAKKLAKLRVPAYWNPVVRDIWRID